MATAYAEAGKQDIGYDGLNPAESMGERVLEHFGVHPRQWKYGK